MAQHPSAKKRARQSVVRRARNRSIQSSVKTRVKRFRTVAEEGDAAQTAAALREAESVLRRAASKGVIPKARVRRQISRLARRANLISS